MLPSNGGPATGIPLCDRWVPTLSQKTRKDGPPPVVVVSGEITELSWGHRIGGILATKILMVACASIVFTLGVVHFVYTFWGTKLTPRDPALQISMNQISPVITKETTMWRCWVGFNASHSMGLILFGLVFGYLALAHGQLLFQSPFLLVVGLAMLGGFVVLSKVYFFSVPLMGICISLACYVGSIVLSRVMTKI